MLLPALLEVEDEEEVTFILLDFFEGFSLVAEES